MRVELKSVGKHYQKTQIIPNLNLDIRSGEFLVLVGPSGCGKSTLLRMIAGLEDQTKGDLLLDGKRANTLTPKERGVAMVFQNYALYPHMSVRDNIAFGLKLAKLPPEEIEKRVVEAGEILNLTQYLDRKPSQLSGGQKQRVAMARAMVRQPKLFLFDEPLSNLDAQLRVKMRAEIAALHRRLGCTAIYVTHDQAEAMTLADRIAVMKLGEIQQLGTPMELYEKPANRFVASFIGTPQMNFVDAKFIQGGPSCHEIGIRPEHITLEPKGDAFSSGNITVQQVERLGSTCYIHGRYPNGTSLVIEDRRPQKEIHVSESLTAYFPKNHIYKFDSAGAAQ